jgi:phosphate-selective porin OprO and OprP
MSRVFLEAIATIGRVIRNIRTALAESQQHLIPAMLAVLVTGVSVSAQAPVPAAGQGLVSLEARVRLLEAELSATRHSLRALAPATPTAVESPAPATTASEPAAGVPVPAAGRAVSTEAALAVIEERLDALDQQIRVTQRLAELEREKAIEQAKAAPRVTAGREGFALRSADGNFQLKLRGYVQSDGRFYSDKGSNGTADTFVMRRVRPILEGTLFKNVDFRVMPDFGEGRTALQDAYLDLRFTPAVTLRAGKFKSPFGLERLASATELLFVDRALPTLLVPNRDIGVQVFGDVANNTVSYALGVFNGVPDGGSADIDDSSGKDVVARLFTTPFRNSKNAVLQQLGFGVAASVGTRRGTLASPGLPTFKTTAQQTFGRYRSDGTAAGTVVADGTQWRVSPQGQIYIGSFGAIAEYVVSSQEVRRDIAQTTLDNRSWAVSGTYVLTGERATPRSVSPQRALDVARGSWGAVELTARYHTLTLDHVIAPIFANRANTADQAKAWDAGVNWYLNRAVKLTAEYEETRFEDGGAAAGVRPTERAVLTRFQVAF